MGAVREWGEQLARELAELVYQGMPVDRAIREMVEQRVHSGQFQDGRWLREQITAVANSVGMYPVSMRRYTPKPLMQSRMRRRKYPNG